jgi:uncharacterized protein
MLYRLEIENFCSIRDRQILDLTIAPNVPDPDCRYAPIFLGSDLRAPKIVAIYGANASGKTTILRALDFIIRFARDSATVGMGSAHIVGFNDQGITSRRVSFAVELAGNRDLALFDELNENSTAGVATYRYEVSFRFNDRDGYYVEFEALRQRPDGKGKWQRVFERDVQGVVKGSTSNPRNFPISGYQHVVKTLPLSASLISTFAKFQHTGAQQIVEALVRVWTNLPFGQSGPHDSEVVQYLSATPEIVVSLNRELRRIDLGLEELRIDTTPNGPLAQFKHAGLPLEMGWERESQGTRKFIKIFPWLAHTLSSGGIAIMDEIDDQIHPLILPEILSWFYDRTERNPHDAQLWLSCHAASLLDDLTKEEVVLCEKSQDGATEFFSLMDVQKVRRSDNLYKKYLSGVYGGVPNIG